MQDGYPEHDIKTTVVEGELVRVHLAKVASHSLVFGPLPSDLEFRFRNVDAGKPLRSIAVPKEALLPRLRADLERPAPCGTPHRRADPLVSAPPSDPVV